MPHQLRFLAMMTPTLPWDEQLHRYQHIESLGFDLAGVVDHFVNYTAVAAPWFEGWSILAALAAQTTRIRLATWVTQIPLRNPALLARQALTVDHISNGRLELGLGIGLTSDTSCEMMGLPNWSYPERVARFREYVEIVDRLLCNAVTTYDGKYYRVNGAAMEPRPVQKPRPPIVIAANGPVMLKRAAELADNWNSISYADAFDAQIAETRERSRLIDRHCAAIGRDPATLRRSYLVLSSARLYASMQVFADVAQQLIDLGITEIGIYYPRRPEQLPVFEKIAREAIPMLKAKHAA
jgi:alkanesulfonate monooxygenase SsuD/methylene tetrahydromethanopterin reductase-like flavin-dependent oxidoreductase (luciferase family)